jgi:uncharacterized tellurite resistance protein B-like protein
MAANTKQLLKILIGAAWLDGKVQAEEQQYLQRIAAQRGLLEDAELHPWLHGLRAVSTQECYDWVKEYLAQNPSATAHQDLLEDISGLIYSDGDVDSAEAKLLTKLQQMDIPGTDRPLHESLTHTIQNLYQRWVKQE